MCTQKSFSVVTTPHYCQPIAPIVASIVHASHPGRAIVPCKGCCRRKALVALLKISTMISVQSWATKRASTKCLQRATSVALAFAWAHFGGIFSQQMQQLPFTASVVPPPPPLCKHPPLAISPTPPHPGRTSLPCFSSYHVLCWFVLPICFTHGLALRSHYFKSSTCVCSVIFSLQRRCMGMVCCVATSDPRSFLLVTIYGTTHAHLVHMCRPLLWALHQMGHNFATFGTYTLVGSLHWIMRAPNSQG